MEIVSYSADCKLADFDCGVAYLNIWLWQYAGQNERRSEARTYLAIDEASGMVAGYYTLLVTSLTGSDTRQGKPRSAPAVLLANLAVDLSFQNVGIGTALVEHALGNCILAAEMVGIQIIIVDALDHDLAGFYQRFGFERLSQDSFRMALRVTRAKKILVDL